MSCRFLTQRRDEKYREVQERIEKSVEMGVNLFYLWCDLYKKRNRAEELLMYWKKTRSKKLAKK